MLLNPRAGPDFYKSPIFQLWEPATRCQWSPGLVEAPQEVPAPWAREGRAMQEGLFLVFPSQIAAQHV